ncbi:MAG: hypothetical protein WA172_00525 [Terriglobales bacterium]
MNMMKPRLARVEKKRDVRIHAELWHTSNCLLRAGRENAEGSAHQLRASLIFRAFALEAFLNWIGPHIIPHWKYLERLTPREKLDLLADIIKVKPDYGARPWQIVKDLFDFRNTLAHGKPENVESEGYEPLKDVLEGNFTLVKTVWESFVTESNAIRAQEDVEKIATILYETANLKHDGPRGPFSFGFQLRSASI